MNNIKEMNDPTLQVGDTVNMQYAPKFNYGWISVKDRLPPINTLIIVHGKDGHICLSAIGDLEYFKLHECTITHWTPLPESPIE